MSKEENIFDELEENEFSDNEEVVKETKP